MSSNERKSMLPKSKKPLSPEELDRTARVLERDLESASVFDFLATPRRKRKFTVSKVYRILYKHVNSKNLKVEYHDAVIPEHRNPSGPEGHQLRGRDPKHVCTEHCCSHSVRIVPVGCEDVLDKLIQWWTMTSKANGHNLESILIEQDSYVAQEQIRDGRLVPVYLYDYVQFMVMDMPVKQYEENGKTVWALL